MYDFNSFLLYIFSEQKVNMRIRGKGRFELWAKGKVYEPIPEEDEYSDGIVPTLETLAMRQYLSELEAACSGYVQLLNIKSRFIHGNKNLSDSILEPLKEVLSTSLSGVASSQLRKKMIHEILTGRYPSSVFRNLYKNHDQFLAEQIDVNICKRLEEHGSKCGHLCCTGAFVVDCMLFVLVNEDLREFKIGEKEVEKWALAWKNKIFPSHRSGEKGLSLSKNKTNAYLPLLIPALFAHFNKAIQRAALENKKVS